MKTENEAIEELQKIAIKQRTKKTNLILNCIIVVMVIILLIISFLSPPITTEKILNDKEIKQTIMAIPQPTINPLATKVKPQ